MEVTNDANVVVNPTEPTPNNEPHTARELELEQKLADALSANEELRRINRELFVHAQNRREEPEKTPEQRNKEVFLMAVSNGFDPKYLKGDD